MNKTLTVLGCALLLLAAGCYFGDRITPPRTVSLNFPTPTGPGNVGLSINDTQVQDAVRVIDTVLTADGLTRDSNPPTVNEPGFIASYSRYNGTGPRPVGNPNVYLKSDRLEVIFTEFWNRSGHLSEATKKRCNSLRKELSNRYGTERIKVE